MFIPSNLILPELESHKRNIRLIIVDFPAQVVHTRATFSHAFTLKDISFNIFFLLLYQNFTSLNSIFHSTSVILFHFFSDLSASKLSKVS
jgi:hypothetical protein